MNIKLNHHENVQKYCIGFVTTKGLMLDLDNVSYKKALSLAEFICSSEKLEGYILVRSSRRHYHIVFNKYISWNRIMRNVFSIVICITWGIWQAKKGELTLRISEKNQKNLPKIVYRKGKTDKLIKDYMNVYNMVNQKCQKMKYQKEK